MEDVLLLLHAEATTEEWPLLKVWKKSIEQKYVGRQWKLLSTLLLCFVWFTQ